MKGHINQHMQSRAEAQPKQCSTK